MQSRTKKILNILKILAAMGAIGYAIECGGHLTSLVASFISPDWAKRGYNINANWYSIRKISIWYFIYLMELVIIVSGLKAFIWYRVVMMLSSIRLQSPFTREVAKKLENISYLLLSVWGISIVGKIYTDWLTKTTGIPTAVAETGGEYIFMAGLVYIISQIFKRGIEIQEENQLTV